MTDDRKQMPTNREVYAEWINVVTPEQFRPAHYGAQGKWCVYRDERSADATWAQIRAAVLSGRLLAAKASGWQRAARWRGQFVICVYVADSSDRADVLRAREVLRELGITEELGFKTDRATELGLTGNAEWLLRE